MTLCPSALMLPPFFLKHYNQDQILQGGHREADTVFLPGKVLGWFALLGFPCVYNCLFLVLSWYVRQNSEMVPNIPAPQCTHPR